jgi:DNA-binding NarL/FixJ family response regulator
VVELVETRPPVRPLIHRPPDTGSIAAVSDSASSQKRLRVLVYSDDVNTRQQVILALGRRPHPDLPEVEYVEVATEPVVIQNMDAGGIDLAILDGEAVPAGGLGIAKQLKDEIYQCPPILVLIGRPQDAWLATWSRAEAAVPHPLDPIKLAEAAVALLRGRVPATT